MAKKKDRRKANFLDDVFITGTLRFPKLNEPDTYEGKTFYSSAVVPDAGELSRVKKLLTAFGKKAFPDDDIWLPIKKDKKNSDIVFFDIKWKKEDAEGNLKRPLIVDSKLKPIPRKVEIGGGTVVTIKATAMDFEATRLTGDLPGVTLLPQSIKIKKLVEGRDALAGFEADEDGWTADGEADIEGSDDAGTETSGDAYDL